ncbi:MAG: sigma 54-interacting transcriptional regulator [Desulfosarcina sp.]|nr:sigma 54-interacting transcriptional regulator [Desulfobacterales bacterium]
MVDANLFFKQATLRICSSLDIETALWRCRQFIADHLPADAIYLNIYEPTLGGLRYVARADATGGQQMAKTIALPAGLIQAIESGQRLKDYLIINRPRQDPLGRIIVSELGMTGNMSFIALRLAIEGRRLGVIDLFARGHDRFSDADAQLLALLREPFAIAMANALRHQQLAGLKEQLASDNRYLNSELISKSGAEVIGAEKGLKGVMKPVAQVAPLKSTVLLLGETGTGKEVIANALHRLSPRRNRPFIKVNCGAMPENLIDSELFGHERGAFTGAVRQKRGRFERAHRGTIFLDEIGELPVWAQVRLLRVLQTGEIERLGGSPPIALDIRVIAATHQDLAAMVAKGLFREDLWFRINAFPIQIPPLRQRPADIALLVHYFITKKSKELGLHPAPTLAPGAIERLGRHHWPGNVRELENTVERALIQHRQGPLVFQRFETTPQRREELIAFEQPGAPQRLDEVVTGHIQRVLALSGGRINGPRGAAALLDVHPNTLRHRMNKLGITYGRRYRRQG